MLERRIADWDNAYSNGANIAGGDRWPAAWVEPAQTFRDALSADERAQFDIAYGDRPRNLLDLFLPEGTPKGLVVFVHGGYWMALDKSYWSHLAKGSIDSGYAVAMPSYSLCPEVRIGDIVREVGRCGDRQGGRVGRRPIMLTGHHSAGGHLVSRMVAAASPLAPEVQSRIRHVVSLSGVHDLRPLINTGMNKTLHIDETEALAESRRCCGRWTTSASPAGSAVASAPSSCARTHCFPISGPGLAPPPLQWSSPTGITSASSTGLPTRIMR
ncbi:alpha/beta hydrolase [Aminobacter sp. BA135]|uniref:alpha/beta hydrolase n=1 Tax=Aminobacter sp. BA135 TaxID=537596 RepID=UPI003D7BA01C